MAAEVEVISPALHVAGARHILDPGEARAGSIAQAAESVDTGRAPTSGWHALVPVVSVAWGRGGY